jgi:CheY-like chemotaxis protein
MDLNMPHLNGIQAMERIRAQCPGVNVILLTAHEDLSL